LVNRWWNESAKQTVWMTVLAARPAERFKVNNGTVLLGAIAWDRLVRLGLPRIDPPEEFGDVSTCSNLVWGLAMPFDVSGYETHSLVTDMLRGGRRKVEAGWCQERMRRAGSVCMIGALSVTDYDSFVQAEELFLQAIRLLGYTFTSVPSFNDEPGRTQREVLAVFNRAIELSRSKA
jgi:hypothetical protein